MHLEPVIKIAKEIGKTPAQVLIRWSIQHEVLTIPKSTKKEHISENYNSLNFKLNDDRYFIITNSPLWYTILHTTETLIVFSNADG